MARDIPDMDPDVPQQTTAQSKEDIARDEAYAARIAREEADRML